LISMHAATSPTSRERENCKKTSRELKLVPVCYCSWITGIHAACMHPAGTSYLYTVCIYIYGPYWSVLPGTEGNADRCVDEVLGNLLFIIITVSSLHHPIWPCTAGCTL
jgi:hypothetical protein